MPVWLIALLSAASSGDGAGDGVGEGEGEEEGELSGEGAGGESEWGEGVGVGVGAGGEVAGEGVGEGEFTDEFVAGDGDGDGAGESADEAMLTKKERGRKTRENLAIATDAIDEIEFENWMVGSEIEMKKTVTNEVGSEKMVVIREKWKVVGFYIGWRIRYEDEMDGGDWLWSDADVWHVDCFVWNLESKRSFAESWKFREWWESEREVGNGTHLCLCV